MSVSNADIVFATDLFSSLGVLTTRKMMGGLCLYLDGRIFAIMSADGHLYLKAAGDFADTLAASGSEKFTVADGRTMGYWSLPDEALDDPDGACDWARRALAAA